MREIKFRAWDKENNQGIFDVSGFRNNFKSTQVKNKQGVALWVKSTSLELMQFIGLKDKNKKEIYSGDIVNLAGGKFIVKWEDKKAKFSLVDRMAEDDYFQEGNIIGIELKVIGNIYENPELLPERLLR